MSKYQSATEAGETNLHGDALAGPEQASSPDHVAYQRKINPDTVLRVDGEKDTLYTDGLELDGDSDTLVGTSGADHLARTT